MDITLDNKLYRGAILNTPLDSKMMLQHTISDDGVVNEFQILYKNNYAPIIENNGELLTQEEYWKC